MTYCFKNKAQPSERIFKSRVNHFSIIYLVCRSADAETLRRCRPPTQALTHPFATPHEKKALFKLFYLFHSIRLSFLQVSFLSVCLFIFYLFFFVYFIFYFIHFRKWAKKKALLPFFPPHDRNIIYNIQNRDKEELI